MLSYERRDGRAPRVPSRLECRMAFPYVRSKAVDSSRVSIATHKAHTGDLSLPLLDHCIQALLRQGLTPVFPQKTAVAARASARTSGDVDGKGHLIGKLLKDDICVEVMKHLDKRDGLQAFGCRSAATLSSRMLSLHAEGQCAATCKDRNNVLKRGKEEV